MVQVSTLQTPHLSDYPELTQVWEDSVRATHDFLPDAYIVLLREHVLRQYLDAVMLICCKDRHQRIQGFAGVSKRQVDMLFVAPAWRGKGIGKALLQHLARRCLDEGVPRLQWWVLDWNTPSIEFYKSQGAVAMDEWTVFRVTGEDLNKLGS